MPWPSLLRARMASGSAPDGTRIVDTDSYGVDARRLAPTAWWAELLQLPDPPTQLAVKRCYRRLAKQHHPDAGGDAEQLGSCRKPTSWRWRRCRRERTAVRTAASSRPPLAGVPAQDILDTNCYYTSAHVIAAAVQAFGEPIDLDPASCALANTVVGAKRYYSVADNGLSKPWISPAVWCNPPYQRGVIDQFVDHAIAEYSSGRAQQILLLTNNCTSEGWFVRLAEHA